ncbi:hypothetical protein [Pseudomonas amygdali]|nr:hypothetical protein [Pseudomonas amygdali]KPC17290.1 Uncharacterized protein AC499_0492 [Pseudomonas amygdali pv. lachrymans]
MAITKLESRIIALAEHSLRQLQGFTGKALSQQDEWDVDSAFLEATNMVQLALIADNGMTEEATAKLKALEPRIAEAMNSIKKEQSYLASLLKTSPTATTLH